MHATLQSLIWIATAAAVAWGRGMMTSALPSRVLQQIAAARQRTVKCACACTSWAGFPFSSLAAESVKNKIAGATMKLLASRLLLVTLSGWEAQQVFDCTCSYSYKKVRAAFDPVGFCRRGSYSH